MKMNRTFLIVITAVFLTGLFLGYGIWGGKKEEKLDVKQLLNKAIQEIEIIEQENRDLKEKLDKVKPGSTTVTELSREKQTLKEQLDKALQDNNQTEALVTQLREELSQTRAKREEERKVLTNDIKKQIENIGRENQALKNQLQKSLEESKRLENMKTQIRADLSETAEKIKAGEESGELSDNLAGRVFELERVNRDLKQSFEKIREMTAGKEPAIPEEIQQGIVEKSVE